MPDPQTTPQGEAPSFDNKYEVGAVPKRIEQQLEQLRRNIVAPIGLVTITPSATTTVVTAPYLISSNSAVLLIPTDATTALEFGLGTTWAVPAKGSFTINHPNNANVRKYYWVAFSGIRL